MLKAVTWAARDAGISLGDLDVVLLNEATPVISGLAMETITETIITESTMIGHDPRTPGAAASAWGSSSSSPRSRAWTAQSR